MERASTGELWPEKKLGTSEEILEKRIKDFVITNLGLFITKTSFSFTHRIGFLASILTCI